VDPALVNRVLDLAVTIQQIPAPTFNEQQRASFLMEKFTQEGLQDVSKDSAGNVYARWAGEGQRPPLVLSAHCDTVFPASTPLTLERTQDKIYGPGIGDNSLGVAGLFGLVWALRARAMVLPGDLWLVANVAEEGLGDLQGMRSVVERFGERVLAYIVLEGLALGQVYNRGLGVKRYRIRVKTSGGHSWVDFGLPSAIHELATLITRLNAMRLPRQPRSSLNVGVISGGTSVNTIAAQAELELDLRSEEAKTLDQIVEQVESLIASANRPGVKVQAEVIGLRPAGEISSDHPLVLLAQRCLKDQGLEPILGIGSTDANIPLSQGLPAVCIGVSTGGSAHTVDEFIHTQPVMTGLKHLLCLVEDAFQVLSDQAGANRTRTSTA
jgi:tripeptide aminopeptidase